MSAPTCDWDKGGDTCGKEVEYVSVGIKGKIPHKYLCKKHGLQMVASQNKSGMPVRVIVYDPFALYDMLEESGYMI